MKSLSRDVSEFLNSLGMFGWKLGLERMNAMAGALNHPERKYTTIHIAGSNGKGTVAHILENIYLRAGYRVALYTSPHLVSPLERLRIQGRPIDATDFETGLRNMMPLLRQHQATYFEAMTLLAFERFARAGVDIAVIETGLGGRLDATNILRPTCSIITTIALEHQNYLGSTLELIAGEKAGIIKETVPCILGDMPETAQRVILNRCRAQRSEAILATDHIRVEVLHLSADGMTVRLHLPAAKESPAKIHTPLLGRHHVSNIASAVAAVLQLQPHHPVPMHAILQGLQHVRIPGRMQRLSASPPLLVDVAHNEQSIRAVLQTVSAIWPQRRLRIVMGLLRDKDVTNILQAVAAYPAHLICVTPFSERALQAEKLRQQAEHAGLPAVSEPSIIAAVETARKRARNEDVILITGSHYVVGEVLSKWPDISNCSADE